MASHMLYGGWKAQENDNTDTSGFKHYSASDILAESHEALRKHRPESRPQHIFGDIVQRLAREDEKAARAFVEEQLSCHDGEEMSSEEIERRGLQLVKGLRKILSKAQFQERMPCLIHTHDCCLSPRSKEELRNLKHIEIGGVTCTPWSSMNRGRFRRWFHEQTLPALTYIQNMLALQPSLLIVENVRGFDAEVMMEPLTRQNRYCFIEIPVNPLDMGIPSVRCRKYLVAFHVAECSLIENMRPEIAFAEMFHSSLELSAEIYMVASREELEAAKAGMGERKGLTLGCSSTGVPWIVRFPFKHLLGGAHLTRLVEYERHFQDALSSNQAGQFSAAWIDLNQTWSFAKTITDTCPALLRGARMWDLVKRRPVLLREMYAAMGFCVPFPEPCAAGDAELAEMSARYWPWLTSEGSPFIPDLLSGRLIGNAMHVSAIAAVLAFALSAV